MGFPNRNKLQYLLSFLFDAHIESRSSPYNAVLDVKYYEGGYILDAKTANFSFGTLHRVFQLAFDQLRIAERPVKSALILGYGGGSIAQLLNERLDQLEIVGVEIDPEVISIAREYFKLDQTDNVKIVEMDAQAFVAQCGDTFDLIAVDLFDDNKVPEEFYKREFMSAVRSLINPGGTLVFNASISDSGQQVQELGERFQDVFSGGRILTIEANKVMVWEHATQ